MRCFPGTWGALLTLVSLLSSCTPSAEAPRLQLPVLVDASGVTRVTTALGYDVDVSSVRLALRELSFTVAGEVHTASAWPDLSQVLISRAHAHPGHYQGGEVIGELRGNFVVDWILEDGRELGKATLIAANYDAANFTFERASDQHVAADDPLLGHTAILQGTAQKDGVTTAFTIIVDTPADRVLVGAPFDADIDEDATGSLRLHFNTRDELEGDTIFDGIDFSTLDTDGDGTLVIAPSSSEAMTQEAYNLFRRTFQTHDHYSITHQE